MEFRLSDAAQITPHRLGQEEQPLLCIDNALADFEGALSYAQQADYIPITPYYPGIRHPLLEDFQNSFLTTVRPLLNDHFGIEAKSWRVDAFISIVTTPPGQLLPIQRLPHYDGIQAKGMAGILYLKAAGHGGTNFFRHRRTGFETITADRFDTYRQALSADVQQHGLPDATYVDDGAPLFERIASIEPAENRLLIYRGVNLHSGAIRNDVPLPSDPVSGRLTVTLFLNEIEE